MTQDSATHRQEVQLSFPPDVSGEPLVCHLVRDHSLIFNILKAQISPRKEGQLTLELIGTPEDIRQGVDYLKNHGVKVLGFAHQVRREDSLCMHCGMCTAMCPAGALEVDTLTRLVNFHQEQCTACGLCTRVCPVNAMHRQVQQATL